MKLLLYIIALVICEAIAKCIIQYAEINKNIYFIPFAIFFYSLLVYFLYLSYKLKKLGIITVLAESFGIILMLVIGRVIFKEQITHNEYIGILFILSGILIIQIKHIINIKWIEDNVKLIENNVSKYNFFRNVNKN
jgi:multidrug transporter EmrE-like cation transporter